MNTSTHSKSRGERTRSVAFAAAAIPILAASALLLVSNTAHDAKELSIAVTVHEDVISTAAAVNEFRATNPQATDVSVVIPTVSGDNKVIAFGDADDFIVCGYNNAGAQTYWKYSSATGEIFGASGSEAGLCGEDTQNVNGGPSINAGSSTPVSIHHSVTSVSGSGGALASNEVAR